MTDHHTVTNRIPPSSPARHGWRAAGRCLASLGVITLPAAFAVAPPKPGGAVLEAIATLEGTCDPKCHATASRLEDFMYGTPLEDGARQLKNQLIKR